MKLRLTSAAEADVREINAWYHELHPELARNFRDSLDAVLASIRRNPNAYPVVYGDFRRAVMRRFPYCVFYVIEKTETVVLACTHGRRNPRTWQSRHNK